MQRSKLKRPLETPSGRGSRLIECPCCGTHVRTLAHLQAFKILRTEAKKQSTLVYFVAGPRLLERFGACVEREKRCVEALYTAAETVPERVRDLVDDAGAVVYELEHEIRSLLHPGFAATRLADGGDL